MAASTPITAATMPIENLDKMKVAELRAELTKLGMDTKGTKPVLLARLKEALANMPEEGKTFYQIFIILYFS